MRSKRIILEIKYPVDVHEKRLELFPLAPIRVSRTSKYVMGIERVAKEDKALNFKIARTMKQHV